MKNLQTLALSGLVAHLSFCLVFTWVSFLLPHNQAGSYKGANLFFVLVFLFWYDVAALVLWHVAASAIDYQGGFRFKHAFWAGLLIPLLLMLVGYFPRFWQVLSSLWTHQAAPPLLAGQESPWGFSLMASLLGLTITVSHYLVYRQVFPPENPA